MAEQAQTKNNITNNSNAQQPTPTRISQIISTEGIQINPRYFISIPGILKVIEWVLAVICIACCAPAQFGGAHWFLFVVVAFFIGTFVWMCVHFFSVPSVITTLPWILIELCYTASASVLYFIAAVVLLVQTADTHRALLIIRFGQPRWEAYIAAGCFGLFNCIVYGVETVLHFKARQEMKQST